MSGRIAAGDTLHSVDDEPVYALDVHHVMQLILGPGGAQVTLWIGKARTAGEPLPPLARVPARAGDVSTVMSAVTLAATPKRDHTGAPAAAPASAKAVQWPVAKREVGARTHVSQHAHAHAHTVGLDLTSILSHTHTRTHTLTHTHTHTHSLTHSLTLSLTHSLTHSLTLQV